MTPSKWLATAALLGSVPVAIGLAYLGEGRGYYGHDVVPFIFGGIFVVVLLAVVGVLHVFDDREL